MLSKEERKMRNDTYQYRSEMFEDEFFRDWYSVLVHKNQKDISVGFVNPYFYYILKH